MKKRGSRVNIVRGGSESRGGTANTRKGNGGSKEEARRRGSQGCDKVKSTNYPVSEEKQNGVVVAAAAARQRPRSGCDDDDDEAGRGRS